MFKCSFFSPSVLSKLMNVDFHKHAKRHRTPLKTRKCVYETLCPQTIASKQNISQQEIGCKQSLPPAMFRSEPCKFVKNYFPSIKFPHAHFQYVCNIPTMHLKDILKALGGVDFFHKVSADLLYNVCTRRRSKCCTFVINKFSCTKRKNMSVI